ncbi:protein-export membrane protein, SecD/SecF family [secondary endosymbiont of Ctenarytaina eucalypti]|uniref:Protein translocase subunit SecD n=2 Tax=secondary endosymbiont of Ctenarytaina eucalypti TaxID=1199245 RepID=J3YR26_9ENTR|nr:protein-export membrane protein, SecD/SecF family [secondary endosymbiont of Ctenarytaina eucalypti]
MMLSLALVLSLVYALPNLYGEDPAVQISGARDVPSLSETTLKEIRAILEQEHIFSKATVLDRGSILCRFSNVSAQLHARDALIKALGENYLVALHLAPATPLWLSRIGARPIKLGLDLRGGVYFLIEVDMDTVLHKLQKKTIDTLLFDLHGKGIPYLAVHQIENYGSTIRFCDADTRDKAIDWLTQQHHNIVIRSIKDNALGVKPANNLLQQARESAVKHNITILRNRINQLGIDEPLVHRQGSGRIVVEMPGLQDMALAKRVLGATGTLEFRLVNTFAHQSPVSSLVPGDSELKSTQDGQPVILYKQVILTGEHITDATSNTDEYNLPQVNISLDRSGGRIMSNFTKENIGNLIATLFVEYKDCGQKDDDGRTILEQQEKVINIATIQSRISNSFRITGIKNPNEARQLSLLLRAGALSAPIQIIEERTIGPTVGRQNISQGLAACFWGLLASILFMIIWYRKFGLIATTAIIANLVLIIGIMSIIPGTTLTMPGIASIVLTLAVAVDANVLINERIKEELRNGRTVQKAIHEGYRGAFSSIVDANITTLITAIILYAVVASGPIKAFAITSSIGVATSMLTAIIGTRAMANLLYGAKRIDNLSI